MPSNRCVVQNCNNVSNPSEGISIHRSPSNSATYAKWIRLILLERTGQTLIRKEPLLFVRSLFHLNVSSECTCKDLGEFSCLILYQQYGKQTRKNLPRLGHDARLVNVVYCSHATHNQLR